MKKFIIGLAALLSFSQPAMASTRVSDICPILGRYANNSMQLRDLGETKDAQYFAVKNGDASPEVKGLLISVVDLVYALPRSTSAYTVQDMVENICYDRLSIKI